MSTSAASGCSTAQDRVGADMYLARVVGDVVSTHRHDNLGGRKLLLVRRLDLDDNEEGSEVIALDVIGVGQGEKVLVVQ